MMHDQLRRFSASERGTVAILFAFLVSILFMFVGMAIDMARLLHVKQIVQASLDAAALAAARRFEEPGISEDEIKKTAKMYFEANVASMSSSLAKLSNFQATPNSATSQVTATVEIEVPTLFFPAGGSTVRNLELPPKAITEFSQTRIEIAMVLDITGSMLETAPDGRVKLETLKAAAKEFADVLYSGHPRPGFIRVAIVPYSASVNAGAFASQIAGPGSDDCVVERSGTDAYSDAPTDWFNRLGRMNALTAWYYSCPALPVTPLTDLSTTGNRAAYDVAIDQLQAVGGTGGHIGIAWGWYVLSNRWSALWGANAGSPPSSNVRKIILLMTDGMFNSAYYNGGLLLPGSLVTNPSALGSAPYQALQICKNIKKSGDITIYSVGFATPPEAAELLKSCSGEANFYDASDSNKLVTSFRSIASKLVSLRLTS